MSFTGIYFTCSVTYIVFSGQVAARQAQDIHELHQLEFIKGIAFCGITSVLGFVISYEFLRRLSRQQARLLAQQGKVLEAEKRATASVFAATIAHDINNILTIAQANFGLLVLSSDPQFSSVTHSDLSQLTQELSQSFGQLSQLSSRLMTLNENDDSTVRIIDLEPVVGESVEFARRHRAVKACTLNTAWTSSARVYASSSGVQRIVLNLVLNAAEATGSNGIIEVRVRTEQSLGVIEVHDNGPGIPPEQRSLIFEPFYSSKEKGTGLGLASVVACVKANHGTVVVEDSELGGACFRVGLPLEKETSSSSPGTQ